MFVPRKMKDLALGREFHGIEVKRADPDSGILLGGDGHCQVSLGSSGRGCVEEGEGAVGKRVEERCVVGMGRGNF